MASRRSARRVGAWLGFGLVLVSALARADPSASQKETARALMAEARELRDKGVLDGALTRFSAADSLMNVPTTGFEVAATQAQLGRLVEARETLRRVLAIAQSPEDPEPFNEARSKARALDQQLLSRIGSLALVVTGTTEGDDAQVTLDGESLPRAALSLPLRVNPGRHVVVARTREREIRREVDALEGQTVSVELGFGRREEPVAKAPPRVEPPPPARPEPPPAAAEARSGLPTLAYVGGAVAVVGLVVGSVGGVSAISHKSSAKNGCTGGSCPPSTWSDLDSAHSMATVSTVGFVVGALGLAVGVGSLLLDNDDAPSPTRRAFVVSPDIGVQSAKLTFAGSF